MATPLVSGLAGLIFSHNSSLTPTQVRGILTSTCVNIDGLNPNYAGKLGAGRIDAAAALNATTTGRQLRAADMALNLYPNPATESLYLSAPRPLQGSLTVLSPEGRQVLQTELEGQQTRLSVAQLPAGIYFLRLLLNDGSQVTDRIVVQ
jgi:subtilisin family serine protease